MGYKVNPPSTEELRRMAVQRLGTPVAHDDAVLTGAQAKQLLEELAISKIEVEIQNVSLQDTCARLDVALNEISDLYDFAPVGFVSTDAGGKIAKLNLVAANMLGAARSMLMGRVLLDFFLPEQRECIQALMLHASASGEDQHCDACLGGGSRAAQYVQLALAPLYALQGHHIVLTNITARQALEDDLRDGEARRKFALQAAGDDYWSWDLRADPLLEGWRQQVYPDDWPQLLDKVQRSLAGQEDRFVGEYRSRGPDGVWKWISCRAAVFERDGDGRATRMLGIQCDISEHKRVQEVFLEVAGIQQAVFELLPHYLAVLDAECRVLRTNAVWNAQGLTSGHAYRNGFARTAYADLLDAVTGNVEHTKREAMAGIAEVIAGKVPSFQLEYSYVAPLEKRWFIMYAMAVQGGQARAVVSHQDVTRIKCS